MADPTPVTPARPAEVTLRGGDLPWRPVSPMLTRVRLITVGIVVLPLLLVTVVARASSSPAGCCSPPSPWSLVGLWAVWLDRASGQRDLVGRARRGDRHPQGPDAPHPGQRPLRAAPVRRHPVRAAGAGVRHRLVRDPHRLARRAAARCPGSPWPRPRPCAAGSRPAARRSGPACDRPGSRSPRGSGSGSTPSRRCCVVASCSSRSSATPRRSCSTASCTRSASATSSSGPTAPPIDDRAAGATRSSRPWPTRSSPWPRSSLFLGGRRRRSTG